jgi:hypothetical protein
MKSRDPPSTLRHMIRALPFSVKTAVGRQHWQMTEIYSVITAIMILKRGRVGFEIVDRIARSPGCQRRPVRL